MDAWKTLFKVNKPRNNYDKNVFGLVGETEKYWILCEKSYGKWTCGGSDRRRALKSTFSEKFCKVDSWHCHCCGTDQYSWRCLGCWPLPAGA